MSTSNRRRESVMALANRAVCLQKLAVLPEAVQAQERAIHCIWLSCFLRRWMGPLSIWLGSPALI